MKRPPSNQEPMIALLRSQIPRGKYGQKTRFQELLVRDCVLCSSKRLQYFDADPMFSMKSVENALHEGS